jgi:hypothetical protein
MASSTADEMNPAIVVTSPVSSEAGAAQAAEAEAAAENTESAAAVKVMIDGEEVTFDHEGRNGAGTVPVAGQLQPQVGSTMKIDSSSVGCLSGQV